MKVADKHTEAFAMTPEITMFEDLNAPLSWLDKSILILAFLGMVLIPAVTLYNFTPAEWEYMNFRAIWWLKLTTGNFFFPLTWAKFGEACALAIMGEILYICWRSRHSLKQRRT